MRTPSSALVTICEPQGSSIETLVKERMVRLAELIRTNGQPYRLTAQLVALWVNVFQRSNFAPEQIQAAFEKAEASCKFWPSPGEVLGFVSATAMKAGEEQAAMKWEEVRNFIRRDYHPDLPMRQKISERTRRAINAAGGLANLSECIGDDIIFARKRFIESYLRWDELQQDQHLLPEGELKRILGDAAANMAVERPKLIDFENAGQKPSSASVGPRASDSVKA